MSTQELANKMVSEMQDAGLTPDEMQEVIARAREIYNQLKTKNNNQSFNTLKQCQ